MGGHEAGVTSGPVLPGMLLTPPSPAFILALPMRIDCNPLTERIAGSRRPGGDTGRMKSGGSMPQVALGTFPSSHCCSVSSAISWLSSKQVVFSWAHSSRFMTGWGMLWDPDIYHPGIKSAGNTGMSDWHLKEHYLMVIEVPESNYGAGVSALPAESRELYGGSKIAYRAQESDFLLSIQSFYNISLLVCFPACFPT